MVHDVWVEVDLSALKHNLGQVRSRLTNPHTKVLAVVKANGYGHGLAEPSRALVEAGADMLGVTRIEEALAIRSAGIEAPLLVFAPIQPENAEEAVRAGLDLTVTSMPSAVAISAAAAKLNRSARIHVKVDTGMGRLGLFPEDVPPFLEQIKPWEFLQVAGIYTHFANAAEADLRSTIRQLERFRQLLDDLRAVGIDYGLAHAANSAAILRLPQSALDLVRPGTLLYGQYPSSHVPRVLDLKPTWRLKARVCEVREFQAGSPIGYGSEYTTRGCTRTAVLPVGFADGFTLVPEGPVYRQGVIGFAARRLRRAPAVEIRGRRAPVLGRVATQTTVVDVTQIDGAKVGDEAVIPALRIPTSAMIARVYAGSSA